MTSLEVNPRAHPSRLERARWFDLLAPQVARQREALVVLDYPWAVAAWLRRAEVDAFLKMAKLRLGCSHTRY